MIVTMGKDTVLSNIDVEKIYQLPDVQVFDVEASVVNNELIVEQSDGVTRNVGQYKGTKGREVEDLIIDADGKLVQQNNNNLPDNTFSVIHYPINVSTRMAGPSGKLGIYTGTKTLDGTLLATKVVRDFAVVTDPVTSDTYRYVLPTNLSWIGTTGAQKVVTSTDGVKVTANSIYSNINYNLTKLFNRTTSSSTDGHLWATGIPADKNYFIIELPVVKLIEGYLFKNMRTDYAVKSFQVSLSVDGINYTVVDIVSSIPSLLSDVVRTITPTQAKFIKFNVLTANNSGSVGRFDLLSKELPVINENLTFKEFLPDERFFNTVETSDEIQIALKSPQEIQEGNAYVSGFLKWENYARFEHVSTTGTGGVGTAGLLVRNLNTVVANNIGITAALPSLSLRKGVYYVSASAFFWYVNYASVCITDGSANILISGQIAYSTTSTTNGSSVNPKLNGILHIEEDNTVIQLRNFIGTTYSNISAQGVGNVLAGINDSDTFAVLEMWKVLDVEELVSGDEQDQYWGNVQLLLNGTNGWCDISPKYNPVMNVGGVVTTAANFGLGYDTSVSPRYLHTLPFISLANRDFTIECFFKVNSFAAVNNIISDNIHSSTNSWVLYINTSGSLVFNQGSSVLFTITSILSLATWYHVALTRKNGVAKVYLNGILVHEFTLTANFNGTRVMVGKANNAANTFNGVLSNIRVTLDVDRYENAKGYFDIPTTEYTQDTVDLMNLLTEVDQSFDKVQFLLNGEQLTVQDDSYYAYGITNTSVVYEPGLYGNIYTANGLHSLMSVPIYRHLGTVSNWVIELMHKTNSDTGASTVSSILSYGLNGASTIDFGVSITGPSLIFYIDATTIVTITKTSAYWMNWHHVAIARNKGSYFVYIDGKIEGASGTIYTSNFTTNQSLYIGSNGASRPSTASFANVRFTIGDSRYTSNFLPYAGPLNRDVADGFDVKYSDDLWKHTTFVVTANSGTAIDMSDYNITLTPTGSFTYPTDTFVDSSTINVIDCGTGKVLTAASHPAPVLRDTDFTIEMWYKPNADTSSVLLQGGTNATMAANVWRVQCRHASVQTTKWSFWVGNFSTSAPLLFSTSDVVNDVWTHVAITRSGNTWSLYVNGIMEHSVTSTVSAQTLATGVCLVGSSGGTLYAQGKLTDVRISLANRYGESFTPPNKIL